MSTNENISMPSSHRHKPKKIQYFQRLGKKQKAQLIEKEYYNRSIPVTSNYDNPCLCIRSKESQKLCSNKVKTETVLKGYNHLVCEAIRKRSDILRDNTHHNFRSKIGVILKEKDGFILKETHCDWFNSSSYDNFYFASNKCRRFVDMDNIVCDCSQSTYTWFKN